MGIKNPDGTPFKVTGSLQQFDPYNPNHNLFNALDQEAIRIGGSPLRYYECFIQFQTIDELYMEDRGKVWSPMPIDFFGYYEPIEPQNPSTQFGMDGIGDVMFTTNYRAVLAAVGHMPKRGSRINTPHLNENWVIVDTRVTDFAYWGAIHLQIVCEKFQESRTTGEGNVSQPKPDYTIF